MFIPGAFNKTILLAEEAGVALYFVHVTSQAGVVAIADARARGSPVYGEVLHNNVSVMLSCIRQETDRYQRPGTRESPTSVE